MRIAMLSDIHGNTIALDAVLADVEQAGGVDEFWVLGDVVALGPDPLGVVERLVHLRAMVLRGNTDRYVVTGERPRPAAQDAMDDPRLVPVITEVAASFAWTAGVLSRRVELDWLAALPAAHRVTFPDGTRALAVHASPRSDEGPGIEARHSDAELGELLAGCDADVVFAGHTHRPVDRRVEEIRAVNLGSVSNPVAPDLRASYVLVETDSNGHRITHRPVPYDHDAVTAELERVNHPGRAWLIAHQRGAVR